MSETVTYLKSSTQRMGSIQAALGLILLLLLPTTAMAEKGNKFPQKRFRFTIDDLKEQLVLVECAHQQETIRGCGFIATLEEKPYLLTSQRLLLGAERISFTTLSGEKLRPRSVELAATRDMARLALAEGEGLALATNMLMGTPVAIFGSSAQNAESNSFYGKINGLGADRIEVSAPFSEENIGCPVLRPNRKVMAMTCQVREPYSDKMRAGTRFESRTRRFCNRLEKTRWVPVRWNRFNQQFGPTYIQNETLIDDVVEVFNSWAEEGPMDRVRLKGKGEVARWAKAHNQVIGRRGSRFSLDFQEAYSESTQKLAGLCRRQARQTKMLLDHRNLNEFVRHQFEDQISSFEHFASVIDYYSTSTY